MPKNASTVASIGDQCADPLGAVIEHGFPGQSWLTFRQALGLGGNVGKGERGTTVVYANGFVPDDECRRARETGEEAARPSHSSNGSRSSTPPNAKTAGRVAAVAPPPQPGLIEPKGSGADPRYRCGIPHRRRPRLLRLVGPDFVRFRLRRPISNRSTGIARLCMNLVIMPRSGLCRVRDGRPGGYA